jgi:hypothetical protein
VLALLKHVCANSPLQTIAIKNYNQEIVADTFSPKVLKTVRLCRNLIELEVGLGSLIDRTKLDTLGEIFFLNP